jgi:hypothetical protein
MWKSPDAVGLSDIDGIDCPPMDEAIETGDPADEACSKVDAVDPTLIARESDCPVSDAASQ